MDTAAGLVFILAGSVAFGFLVSSGIESAKREAAAEQRAKLCSASSALGARWEDSTYFADQSKKDKRKQLLAGLRAHFPAGSEEDLWRLADFRFSGACLKAMDLVIGTDSLGMVGYIASDSLHPEKELESFRSLMVGRLGVPGLASSRILMRLLLDSTSGEIRKLRFVTVDGPAPMDPEVAAKWEEAQPLSLARSPESILKVIRASTADFKVVYDGYLKRIPDLGGKISVRLTISPAGRIVASELSSSSSACDSFDREMLNRIQAMVFEPIPYGTTLITYAFVFERDK